MLVRRLILVALGALAISGCATQGHQQITALKRADGAPRILLMPLNVELYELSTGGMPEPKADWTEQANRYVTAALRAEKAARQIKMIDYTEANIAADRRDDATRLVKLHGVVGQSILIHQYGETLPTKQGRFEWSLGPQASTLKEAFGADYALFVYIRDSYSSAGRVVAQIAAALLGVGIQGGTQIGFLSLVDLETGDVVWFNRLLRGNGDLRTEAAARETVQTLLAGLPQ